MGARSIAIAIGALGVSVALSGAFMLGAHSERYKTNLKLNETIIKAVRGRAGIDAKITNMDAVALCLELGGVPDRCEQLRRLGTNIP